MEVLILNGSPRAQRSVTGRLLDSLAGGLVEGGAAVTRFRVADMNIGPCKACLSCMHRNPGVCSQRDDMDQIYERLKVSDLLVLGTPVYVDNMTAQLKMVMDRCVCSLQPFLTRDGSGRVRHPQWWRMPPKYLLVSTCGFPEKSTFDPLIATFRAQAANAGSRPLGEVCMPGSVALQIEPSKMTRHLQMLHLLGLHLSAKGDVDPGIMETLSEPPLTTEEYLVLAAAYEAWCREKLAATEV